MSTVKATWKWADGHMGGRGGVKIHRTQKGGLNKGKATDHRLKAG